MEVKTITYKRVNNLGNYNTEHLEMTAELIPHEDEIACTARLKELVETSLGINKTKEKTTPKPAVSNEKKPPF